MSKSISLILKKRERNHMLQLLQSTEITYIKCFSKLIEEENVVRFTDQSIPDMYAHNFILLNSDLSNKEINRMLTAEIERSIEENKSFLQVELTASFCEKSIENLSVIPQITRYIYMSIPTKQYHSLSKKSDCTVEEALSAKVLQDGVDVDIQANSFMGEDFSKRRIGRKVQAYNTNSNLSFYVCYDNDTPVGNCELFINNQIAKIEDFDIIEKYQRKGFGTAVLKHLLQAAENLGVETAYVVTDSEDTAKEMYQKCGFTVIGEKTTLFFQL